MEEEIPKLTPQQEIKEKLRLTRANFTNARNLIKDIEKTHDKFIAIRNALQDKENGVDANKKWLANQRNEILKVLQDSTEKLNKLELATRSVNSAVTDINSKYEKFKPLSIQIFDRDSGLEATLRSTRRLKKLTEELAKKIEQNATDATEKLTSITATAGKVQSAYKDFLDKKSQIDDSENGFEAQLRRATEYAESIQDTKTKSESALVSITKYKDQTVELVGQIKDSKNTVTDYQKQSETLTKDIRNTLNKVTQFTLSKALQERTKSFSRQMWFWAILQVLAISALTYAVYIIFEILFVGSSEHPAITSSDNSSNIVPIVSKFLFTTPLIFAVYVTTTNYRHARDLRDKYAWKETVAKNFQNYIKLVKDEFKDSKYEEERFKFSMDTVRSIYSEPNPLPKKRRYNFSLKTVQLNIEEEDLRDIKESLSYDIRQTLARQEGEIEDIIETSIADATKADAKQNNTKKKAPSEAKKNSNPPTIK